MEVEVTLAKTEKYLFAISSCLQYGQIPTLHWEKSGCITPTTPDCQGLPFGDLIVEFESQRAELEPPPTLRSRPLIYIK